MEKWSLPEGWTWRKIEEVCKVNPRRPSLEISEEVPTSFVPMAAVDEDKGAITAMEIKPYREVMRGYTYFEEEDVLFAKITPSMENGKAAIARGLIDGLGFGSTEFHRLRPKEDVIPEWIYFFVRQKKFRREAAMHFRGSVGQQRVPKGFLAHHLIPVAPLNGQRRIVARIEGLFAELGAARRLHAALVHDEERLMDAALMEAFEKRETWQTHKLGELVTIEAKQVDPTLPEYRDLPHINGSVIEPITGRLGEYQTAAEDGMTSAKYHFFPGAVLYSKIRPYLRKAATVDFEGVCSADMYPLRVETEILSRDFLKWTLLSHPFTEYASELSGRARMPKLNRKQIFAYPLQVPDLAKQHRIVAYLDEVQAHAAELQHTAEAVAADLDRLEQSILAEAFRGTL